MKKKDKPLPRPPKTPFGRKRPAEDDSRQGLLADKMAEAAATGDLSGFLDRELPDSEHARALANMMMGMTGMLPQGEVQPPVSPQEDAPAPSENAAQDAPAGVREAVQAGDVKGLIEMLRQEHRKRSGSTEEQNAEPPSPTVPVPEEELQERVVLDRLIALSREHSVSPDWIVQRALKLYFEEYKRTGRL